MKRKTTSAPINATIKVEDPPVPFRALMTQSRQAVVERLQMFGDFPECKPGCACDLDYLHAVMQAITEAAHYVRLESHEPDPRYLKKIKRYLAITASACEMWAESLEESK